MNKRPVRQATVKREPIWSPLKPCPLRWMAQKNWRLRKINIIENLSPATNFKLTGLAGLDDKASLWLRELRQLLYSRVFWEKTGYFRLIFGYGCRFGGGFSRNRDKFC